MTVANGRNNFFYRAVGEQKVGSTAEGKTWD
jgi:hypothetical protein